MVNETSGATATRLTPVVSISRSEVYQASGLSGTEGKNLKVEEKATPQVQQAQVQLVQSSQQSSSGIEAAVREINAFVQNIQRDLSFNMDEVSGRTVIKVIDRDSGDTVRQIPSEEVLEIARSIRDVRDSTVGGEITPTGLLFSKNT